LWDDSRSFPDSAVLARECRYGESVRKLLVVAPTCDREDVGEAWVAYQWVQHLAGRFDVTLLTYHKRGRTPPSTQLPGVRVVEWAEPPLLGRAERLNSMLKPGYIPFFVRARRWIRTALARGERFELAHQPVPVAMRYPSPLVGLGIPYLIGPVGGSLDSPPGFGADEDTDPWYVRLRALDEALLRRFPQLRRTYEDAACVLGIAPYVSEHLRGLAIRDFATLSETALPRLPDAVQRPATTDAEVRLLFVGRLVRTKGAREAIRAVGQLAGLPVLLDVVGDGPDRGACQRLAADLGAGERVRFHGRLPREAVDDFYRRADVFVFPSYREPGGNVAFEAMGYGLPLVVCDRGGPGAAVDDSCGIRVPAVSPDQLGTDVASAIAELVKDPELRRRLGEGARRRVAEVGLWPGKVDQVERLYARVLDAAGRA
jgi:glycosyltransferase involved in cell wall biosynthesis